MVDFSAIRPIRGSSNNGFEELCCQLAGSESGLAGRYVRNGTPDGGVECYWVHPDDSESGWQAKYFDKLDKSQWQQMDESVETVLRTHPRLTQLTFCLPLNLADARVPGKTSQWNRWDERVAKWRGWAAERSMDVKFDLWDETQLLNRLSRPENAGRRWFWFRSLELGPNWVSQHVAEALAGAGPRYTPEVHVDLPLAQYFDTLGHTPAYGERLHTHIHALRQVMDLTRKSSTGMYFVPAVTDAGAATLQTLLTSVWGLAEDLPVRPATQFEQQLAGVRQVLWGVRTEIEAAKEVRRREGTGSTTTPRQSDYIGHDLDRCQKTVSEFENFIESSGLDLAIRPALLIDGEAGTGKSHLLCDIARRRAEAGLPTLLVLCQQLSGRDFWSQLIQTGLGLECSREELLGALSSAGEAAGGRALILIDALNEATEIVWRDELPRLLEVVSRYPRVGLAVSCRSTYLRLLVRDDLLPARIKQVTHSGFADATHDSVGTFCRHYGVEALNAPPLTPEFDNPLFLKLFCEGLRKQGLKRPPRGQSGLREVFTFFLNAVNHELSRPARLDYDEDTRPVHRAVDAIADEMIRANMDHVPKADAERALFAILPTARGYSRSLLRHLITEGILAEDVYWDSAGNLQTPVVRFAYERLADFEVVRRLLDAHVDPTDPGKAFAAGGRFAAWFSSPADLGRWQRFVPVLMIQLHERTGREIADFLPLIAAWPSYRAAFLEALTWRRPTDVTAGVRGLFEQILEDGPHGSADPSGVDAAFERACQLAAIPNHLLNARWLHEWLSRLARPERDRIWSTYLHRAWARRARSAVERLIDWAWPSDAEDRDPATGYENEVVALAATALTWCLTTSNRFIRDRATKALVSLLYRRPSLLSLLLDRFGGVDDLYLVERLYAVCYGCVLRTRDRAEFGRLAQRVFDRIFSTGQPPAHVLLRDYARGIVELSLHDGCQIHGDMGLIRPPYKSEPPPQTAPAWEDIRTRYDDSAYSGLIQSLWPNGGDFDRYVLGTNVGDGKLPEWTAEPNPFLVLEGLNNLRVELPPQLANRWAELTNPLLRLVGRGEVEGNGSENRLEESDEDRLSQSEQEVADQVEEFVRSLSDVDRSLLDQHVAAEDAWQTAYNDLQSNRPDNVMPSDLPCRWIFQRVLELGWTPERFGPFDDHVDSGYGREEKKPERVGKKYQWLAYHELTARIFDHRPQRHDVTWGTSYYEGPWQQHLRQIDPSCLLAQPAPEGSTVPCWWVPIVDPLRAVEAIPDALWMRDRDSIPDLNAAFSPTNPRDGRQWLTLRAWVQWQQSKADVARLNRMGERMLSSSIFTVLVSNARREELLTELANTDWGGTDIPSHEFYAEFLGEHAWAPSFRELNEHASCELTDDADEENSAVGLIRGTKIPVASTGMRYLGGSCGFDCSHTGNDAAGGYVPSVWLARRLGLRWAGRRFDFTTTNGATLAYDPSYAETGPGALLVERGVFREFLRQNDLTLVWLTIGQKMVFGGSHSSEDASVMWFRRHYYLTAEVGPIESNCRAVYRSRKREEVIES